MVEMSGCGHGTCTIGWHNRVHIRDRGPARHQTHAMQAGPANPRAFICMHAPFVIKPIPIRHSLITVYRSYQLIVVHVQIFTPEPVLRCVCACMHNRSCISRVRCKHADQTMLITAMVHACKKCSSSCMHMHARQALVINTDLCERAWTAGPACRSSVQSQGYRP